MFFLSEGSVYRRAFNAQRITTFSLLKTIKCKLVHGSSNDTWFDGAANYDIYRMYTRDMALKIGDKVTVDDIDYVIEWLADYKWSMKSYSVYIVKRSQWR